MTGKNSIWLCYLFCWCAVTTATHAVVAQELENKPAPVQAPATTDSIVWTQYDQRSAPGKDGALAAGVVQRWGPTEFRRSRFNVQQVGFCADNRTVVTYGRGSLDYILTDTTTGQTVGKIESKHPDLSLKAVRTSSNGSWLATYAFQRGDAVLPGTAHFKLFRTSDRSEVAAISWKPNLNSDNYPVAVSNDGRYLAKAGPGTMVQLWLVGSTQPETIRSGSRQIEDVLFSSDSTIMFARSRDTVYAWSLTDKKLLYEIGSSDRIETIAVSEKGHIAILSDDDTFEIEIFDTKSGERKRSIAPTRAPRTIRRSTLSFVPRSSYLFATFQGEGLLEAYDAETGKVMSTRRDIDNLPSSVAISPSGELMAGVAALCKIDVWRLKGMVDLTKQFQGHSYTPLSVQFDASGTHAVSVSRGSEICHWAVDHASPLRMWLAPTEGNSRGSLTCAAVSPDGRHALTLGFSVGLDMWDLQTGKLVYHLPQHGRLGRYGSHAVAFAASGKQFFSFGPQYFFRRWDMKTGKCLLETRPYPGPPVELEENGKLPAGNDQFDPFGRGGDGPPPLQISRFSADGSKLFYLADKLYVVDTRTGKIADSLDVGHSQYMELSADASHVATSTLESVTVHETDSSKARLSIADLSSPTPKSLSADGSLLVVREYERGAFGPTAWLSIFETSTGQKRYHIDVGPDAGQVCQFSPDAQKLAATQGDSTIHIYHLPHFRAE